MDTEPITAHFLARCYGVDGGNLERAYKNHLSDFPDWDQAGHAEEWVLLPKNLGERICIDETQIGDDVYTIVSNWDGHCRAGSLIAVAKGTAASSVVPVLLKLPEDERMKVAEATMDMSESMRSIVSAAFPNATVTLDVFHMVKRCIDGLEEIRLRMKREAQAQTRRERAEFRRHQRKLAAQRRRYRAAHPKKSGERRGRKRGRANAAFHPQVLENGDTLVELLTRSKCALSKSREKWGARQKERMAILFDRYPKLREAYGIVDQIRAFFRSSSLTRDTAKKKLHEWYDAVAKCTLREIKSARDALRDREEDLLNYFISHSTNAMAESFNSKVKGFRAQLRGIRDIPFFMFRLCKIFG